jgi:hypothetical protein
VVGRGAFSKYFTRYGCCSCWTKGDEDCARKNARLRDANGQALSYIYYACEPGRRSAAKLLSKDEARRIAANIAKLSAEEAVLGGAKLIQAARPTFPSGLGADVFDLGQVI